MYLFLLVVYISLAMSQVAAVSNLLGEGAEDSKIQPVSPLTADQQGGKRRRRRSSRRKSKKARKARKSRKSRKSRRKGRK